MSVHDGVRTTVRRPEATAGYEELRVVAGPRSGATIAIAVHSTALGPALGGARMWHYETPADGIEDALRLARAMTYKAAAAGLLLGGGKGVICAPGAERPAGESRRAMLLDFGDAVASLGDKYVTAEDVGTGAADMATIAERTSHVVGLPGERGGSGDPSPVTARGVLAALRACLEHRFGDPSLGGVRVCVVGAGHVGGRLARLLVGGGAEVTLSDVDPARRALAEELGAAWLDPDDAITADCDVLAPCALGEVIDAGTVEALRCAIVCGAANNVLAAEPLAADLTRRGIVYAPDFIANAGGLINVYAELHRLDRDAVSSLVDHIGATVLHVLAEAGRHGTTPLAEAQALALRRLRAAPAAAA
ncbi:MAG TPA: Glu/Leu/Phe/Val dehydrogenase dimerization domain-containing protein [Solirubrobacterales bacterium]|nr:Glu/Leu/Phe/Val dehydrogenase dimerization domain-containing protein [Solirubrobacterales bacterium]